MLRYNYTVTPENIVTDLEKNLSYDTFRLTRTIAKQYLDEFNVENEIASLYDVNDIKKHFKEFEEGKFNKPLIVKEEAWFKLYESLVKTIAEINDPKTKAEDLVDLEKNKLDLEANINAYESYNKWLTEFYTTIDTNAVDFITKRPTMEGFQYPKTFLNRLIAYKRDTTVRNPETTMADLAKINSFLFSMVGMIYGIQTTTAKAKLPAAEKGLLEYSLNAFKNSQTRADRQLLVEGTGLIDKLLGREVAIADIIDDIKK